MERVIKVKEIYTVDRISNTNSKAWVTILNTVDLTTPVLLDFAGIDLISPWTNLDFKKILSNENVHIKVYNSAKVAQTLEMMCIIDGLKSGRIENEDIVQKAEISKEQLKINKMAGELQSYFETDDKGIHALHIYKRFNQLGSVNTVNYIEEALKIYCEKHGLKEVDLVTKNIFIQDNIVEMLSKLIVKFSRVYGINLSIDSTDDEVAKKLKLFVHNQINKQYDVESREETFRNELKLGTVGLLVRYKKSTAVDTFGRQGNGVPVSCRLSIYVGLVRNQNTGVLGAKFRTFDKNFLYTRTHWGLEHDGEILERLHEDTVVVDLNEIGLKSLFLGSRYHFMLPLQQSHSETITMYGIDENGSTTRTRMTIPERAKAVFDDFNINYNKEELDKAIEDTRKYLDSIEL